MSEVEANSEIPDIQVGEHYYHILTLISKYLFI